MSRKLLITILVIAPASLFDLIWTNTGYLIFHLAAGLYLGLILISIGILIILNPIRIWEFWHNLDADKQIEKTQNEKKKKVILKFYGIIFISMGSILLYFLSTNHDFVKLMRKLIFW